MTLPLYTKINTYEYHNGTLQPRSLMAGAEYPVAIVVNGSPLVTIACSAVDIEFLVMGHLLSEQIISSVDEVRSCIFDEKTLIADVRLEGPEKELKTPVQKIVSAGGRGKVVDVPDEHIRKDLPGVHADTVTRVMDEFLHTSKLRDLTHGFHAAALYTIDGESVVFFDEIGRHSAIDKVIGFAAVHSVSMADKMILSTGRVSSEIAGKILCSGVSVFVSRAAPTDTAAGLLKKSGIIFMCRAKKDRFTVVGGADHLILRTSS